MDKLRVGFAMCGSFCTYAAVMPEIEKLAEKYDLQPIMSEISCSTDTRFGNAEDFCERLRELSGKDVICSIKDAEPIGPKKLLDVLVIAPCTGNTLAKIAAGITDSAVTMACKAHLRNERPVVIAVSSNDALSANACNLGTLLNRKHIYFVPFKQDDCKNKPTSIVADMTLIEDAVAEAMRGRQIQPLLV